MLLTREVLRLLRSIATFTVATRRIWMLLAIVVAAVVAFTAGAVTIMGPVSFYTFI